ncbi:MAG: InlB B-repeat-containing protein [Clostridia bacterium]|nr:InlB B-repeat-containing protein [Clostridia bacterium]
MKMKWMKTAVALVLCLVMVSVSVVAAAEQNQPIIVHGGSETVSNVDVEILRDSAVTVGAWSWTGGMTENASLTVLDSIKSTAESDVSHGNYTAAAELLGSYGYEAFLSVANNVIAIGKGISAHGIGLYPSGKNSVAKAEIGGNVVAQEISLGSDANDDLHAIATDIYTTVKGEADLYVEGNVIADADNGQAIAVNIDNSNSITNAAIFGDVTANGNENAVGLAIRNNANPGVTSENDKESAVNVLVGGNVSSTGYGLVIGTPIMYQAEAIDEESESATKTRVEILGDLTAENYAIGIIDAPNTDIIVDGTVEGGKAAVVIKEDADISSTVLTVWKMIPDENGALLLNGTLEYGDNSIVVTTTGQNKEAEKNINYIIRVIQPDAGATLSVSGTTEYEGYDVAREGDTVFLNAVMMPGWRILNAYWDEYQSELMTALNDRTFYMVVPHGGGVVLSALLEKTQKPECTRPNITVTYRDPADSATAYAGGYLTVNPNKKTGKHYMVAMVGNGGTIDGRSTLTKSVKEGDSLTLPIPVQDGKTFLGWSTGDNTELIPGGTSVVITEKVAYRAMWN